MRSNIMQLMRDNAQARTRFEINAQEGREGVMATATVYLYDVIGGFFGVSAEEMVREINALDVGRIDLRVNSPGGDVFEARAIMTALAQHPAEVVAHIDGIAASAASYPLLVADRVVIARGGFVMVHNAWAFVIGDADDLRATAETLDKVDRALVNDYARFTGAAPDTVRSWLAEDTWFDADEAVDNGFASEIYEPVEAVDRYNLSAYGNAPRALTEPPAAPTHAVRPALSHSEMAARLALTERTCPAA